jgi:sulfur-carrier protein adenylyltransferase/sulfurtransferase
MILWFLANQKRLSVERAAIEELQRSAEWLVGVEWLISGGLCVDAVIRAHGHDYEVRLEYPRLFPEVPPTVRPRKAEGRWSSHQYGNDGPLCLEWGPDNWHPDVTGAQVLESAYRLLEVENPVGVESGEGAATAPSRHALTQGQELRGRYGRFYASDNTLDYLAGLPDDRAATFRFSVSWRTDSWLAVVHEAGLAGEDMAWTDPLVPKYLRGSDDDALRDGVAFKSNLDASLLESVSGVKGISDLLVQVERGSELLTEEGILKPLGGDGQLAGALIFDRDQGPHFFVIFKDGDTRKLAAVRSDPGAAGARTPRNLEGLGEKSVGIVGLGSVGSKVAISLARMGVGRFYLADYDIFLPENASRHALDWGSVGGHKVDALREAIGRIGAGFEVEVSKVHITGQESTAAVSGVLDRLGRCDLLIDATAEPGVFNLLSAVATTYKKPLVWMQVYGGGFGGMIARSRPGDDPPPQTMRAAYLDYCHTFPAPEAGKPRPYAAEDTEGEVFIASDADVGVIAHHGARFAADTLVGQIPSAYPYSMYLIGLAKWWVFEAPFATIPIATAHLMGGDVEAETQGQEGESESDNVAFVVSLLEKLGESSSPS